VKTQGRAPAGIISVAGLTCATWGRDAPGWIIALAGACDLKGLTSVAQELGVSSSLVKRVLCNHYPGDLSRLAHEVHAKIIAPPVDCPHFGKLSAEECQKYQDEAERRNTFPRHHLLSLMYPDCRRCELSRFVRHAAMDGEIV
jgi:hypothetical protein